MGKDVHDFVATFTQSRSGSKSARSNSCRSQTITQDSLIIKQILEAGALFNTVGDDEAVIAAVQRYGNPEVGIYGQVDIEEWIRTRGVLPYHLTPVHIFMRHWFSLSAWDSPNEPIPIQRTFKL